MLLRELVQLSEKWDTDQTTNPNKKGMFDGWTIDKLEAELKKELDKPERDTTYIKELEFAIRAKRHWQGSV